MALTTQQQQAVTFRKTTASIATAVLRDWVGEEKAGEAVGRVSSALAASAAAARDPSDFYACTPESVARTIAVAALTNIMPGVGSGSLAYAVPQRPRKGEAPQLDFRLSHRGINALARRSGQTMIAIPIGVGDEITIVDGEVSYSTDIDDPPTEYAELRGVVVVVKELSSGVVVHRGWMPKKLIDKRRAMSLSAKSQYSPWAKWPIEMSMKTAMHYTISRGWCVVDDTASEKALSHDSDFSIDVSHPPLIASDSTGSRSDQLADRLSDESSKPTHTYETAFAALQECKTPADIEALWSSVDTTDWPVEQVGVWSEAVEAQRRETMNDEQ